MRVRALEKGFIGGAIRREGEEFEVSDKAFSKKWMEKVKGKHKKAEPVDESEVKAHNIPPEAVSTLKITEPEM